MKSGTKVFRRILTIAIALGLLATVVAGLAFGPDLLSQFTFQEGLRTLNGDEAEIEDMFGDAELAYVVFWRVGCAACTKQLKALSQVGLVGGRVAVVAVNIGDSESKVRKHLEKNEIQTWADFPVLIGFAPTEEIEAVPVLVIMARDGEQWEYLGSKEGFSSIEDLETLAYRMFIGAMGGVEFWGGSFYIEQWYDHDGHQTFIGRYDGEYEPTAVEIVRVYDVLLRVAELGESSGFYLHTVVNHETYGDVVVFSIATSLDQAKGFHATDDEDEAAALLNTHFWYISADSYYYATLTIPLWNGEESLALVYSYLSADMVGHPWAEDIKEILLEMSEAEAE